MARRSRRSLDPVAEKRRKHLMEGVGLFLVILVAVFFCYLAFSA